MRSSRSAWRGSAASRRGAPRGPALEALGLGIFASFFFAFTFVLNRRMSLQGGSWMWSASLRYLLMLPMLLGLSAARGELTGVLKAIARRPLEWILWSSVGFGLFYSFICAASLFGPSWLLAATWQVTIVAGLLLSPLFFDKIPDGSGFRLVRHRIPGRALAMASVILLGIGLMQLHEAATISPSSALASAGLVLVAAFSYPLGNRKMMELCEGAVSTEQRVCGMTICSTPFWIVLGATAAVKDGPPGLNQVLQSFLVALFAGVAATLLFFKATDLVREDIKLLAVVESTQSGEVVFTLVGGLLVLGDRAPSPLALAGLGLVVLGMVANALSQAAPARKPEARGRQGAKKRGPPPGRPSRRR
jgi:drug/metabolite transporter (DMT)-like permease